MCTLVAWLSLDTDSRARPHGLRSRRRHACVPNASGLLQGRLEIDRAGDRDDNNKPPTLCRQGATLQARTVRRSCAGSCTETAFGSVSAFQCGERKIDHCCQRNRREMVLPAPKSPFTEQADFHAAQGRMTWAARWRAGVFQSGPFHRAWLEDMLVARRARSTTDASAADRSLVLRDRANRTWSAPQVLTDRFSQRALQAGSRATGATV